MAKCKRCGKNSADYEHIDGEYVCSDCIGSYFTCPDCGRLFPQDTGDAGNGFCYDCASEH